jgi:thiamine-phosphate pyrophosphorylase
MHRAEVDYTLYVCTDPDLMAGRDFELSLEEAIAGGVSLVQVREKTASSREFYAIAQRAHRVTRAHGIPLIINDRVDIALAVDAEGVHLGQEDLELKVARQILGAEAIIGVSVQGDIGLAQDAEREGADYLGVGEVFATTTKLVDRPPIGPAGLQAVGRAVNIPVVAIGGITPDNIAAVRAAGVEGACVISAIWGHADIRAAARALRG